MPGDPLRQRDTLVRSLMAMLQQGEAGLSAVPDLVVQIVAEDAWRKREIGYGIKTRGEIVEWTRFEDFVTAPPLAGLGATMTLLRNLCRDVPTALDALDRVTQRPKHVHADVANSNIKQPTGTTRAAALRRLRKDRPDLHSQVLSGTVSAHRAMVEAGFRKEKTPLQQLAHWWQKATDDERQQFLDYLNSQQRMTA